MYVQYFDECLYNPKVSAMIKTIIFLNILLIIGIFFRYKPKVSKEAKLIFYIHKIKYYYYYLK